MGGIRTCRDIKRVLGVETSEQVQELFKVLTTAERRTLEEYYGVGCKIRSTVESARAEGVTKEAIRSRRYKALGKLKRRSIVVVAGVEYPGLIGYGRQKKE